MNNVKLYCGDVKGLPGFRFYRHFIEEMLLPFVRVDVDDEKKEALVGRLDKIAGLLGEKYALFFESYMSTAKVVEVRRYGVPPPQLRYKYETVAYRGDVIENCSIWRKGIEIIVRYDANGELLGYTFPDRDPEPMEVSAWLGDFEDESMRVERIIDYMCDTSRFDGMFVSAEGGNSTFSVSRHGIAMGSDCHGVRPHGRNVLISSCERAGRDGRALGLHIAARIRRSYGYRV